MNFTKDIHTEIKNILEQSSSIDQLDQHPWTQCLAVAETVAQNPALANRSPGYQLLATLSALFQATMPNHPPRKGKRLDTQWGQFGMLGTLYFAPFDFNLVRPASLLDAWGRMDAVILRYVFGDQVDTKPADELAIYCLTDSEIEAAPKSTISGWHVKGLERLADEFIAREQNLASQNQAISPLFDPQKFETAAQPQTTRPVWLETAIRVYRQRKKEIWIGFAALLILLVSLQGLRIFSLYRAFRADVDQLQALVEGDLSADALAAVGPLLTQTRSDVVALRKQVAPFGWAGRLIGWLPVYGGDLANAKPLLDLAANLVIAGDEGYRAAAPLIETYQQTGKMTPISQVLTTLEQAQPQIATAQTAAEQALLEHSQIEIGVLSPKTRPLLEKIDPYLPFVEDGIAALSALPKIAGSAGYGPQTYLILLQNEDEIRATGGFITAVGTVTVENGELIGYKVEDSYAVDDLTRVYPQPPWQLEAYMDAPIWVLRDANWSPDFPTTAGWVEHLYAYYSAHGVDGVIAIDQRAIQILLKAIGPTEVAGFAAPVSADNLIEMIRQAKDPADCAGLELEKRQNCKGFMQPMADAMLTKLQTDRSVSFTALAQAGLDALDQRHILVYLDDPTLAKILANRGWDGALRAGNGDFLMAVNTNIGYNKMDSIVETRYTYTVDLTNLQQPQAELAAAHSNPAPMRTDRETCLHTFLYDASLGYLDLLAQCYWNYFRFYTLAEAQLLDSDVHAVPGEWLELGNPVPARVDELDNSGIVIENPDGLRAFGTLFVVPWSETLTTRFRYTLPPAVLAPGPGKNEWQYRLHVQKQPGTLAIPLAVGVALPAGAELISAVPKGKLETSTWQVNLKLLTDQEIVLSFRVP